MPFATGLQEVFQHYYRGEGDTLSLCEGEMEPLEHIVQEISSFENHLNRRSLLKLAFLMVISPGTSPTRNDDQFLQRVTATLMPAEALKVTGIDVAANLDYLLRQGSAEHRKKVLEFVSWARRASILYGGEKIAINARRSRFVLVRKTARTLSSLCLISFWADERALRLIHDPEQKS